LTYLTAKSLLAPRLYQSAYRYVSLLSDIKKTNTLIKNDPSVPLLKIPPNIL